MLKVIQAERNFLDKRLNCAQSIFITFCEEFGIPEDLGMKLVSPFGGGLASSGEVCGVIIASLMIIGLKYGYTLETKEQKNLTYEKSKMFIRKFKERNHTIICRELLKCDIGTPEGRKRAEEEKLFTTICPKFIRDGVEILEEILKD